MRYFYLLAFYMLVFILPDSVAALENNGSKITNHSINSWPLDEDEPAFEEAESSLDTDDPDALILVSDTPEKEGTVADNLFHDVIKDMRFTFLYDVACQMDKPEKIVENRSSLRFEWNYFFLNHVYLIADGKASVYGSGDHIASAENRSWLVDGDFREGFLQVSIGKLSLRAGKQIVVWGEADGSVVTDVISPRDQSDFVYTTLEDSRVGQYLFLLDVYSDTGTWSFILNPNPEFNKEPDPETEYYIDMFPSHNVQINEKKQDYYDIETSFRWKRNVGKSDVSFMAGDFIQNNPVYRFQGYSAGGHHLILKTFSRFQMAGITANFCKGNLLWKTELAWKYGLAFQSTSSNERLDVVEKTRVDMALGLDYTTGKNLTLGLEAANQFIQGWRDSLESAERNNTVINGFWQHDYLSRTLHTDYRFSYQIQNRYVIHKLKSDYEFTDQLQGSVSLSYFDFQKREVPLATLRNKYRASISIQYQW